MAGIGFRLNKYFASMDFYKNVKGSLYSVVLSSGPWLTTVLSIAVLSIFAKQDLYNKDFFVFKCIISYTFAFSLIIFGAFEFPLTRYLADKIYLSDSSSFTSVYVLFVGITSVISSISGWLFYSYFDWGLDLKILCISLLCSTTIIWLSMIFLSAAKNYHQIVLSFILGSCTSIGLGLILGLKYNLIGYVIGFSCGQIFLVLMLARSILAEFGFYNYLSFEVLQYYSRYKRLIFLGLFYYLGIWVDKFIFWFGRTGVKTEGLFYMSSNYDTAMFLSYVTIVPALAIFLVKVETSFYEKYSYYYQAIINKNNLKFLEHSLTDMIRSLRSALVMLIKGQAFVSICVWFFADQILTFFRLPSVMIPVFKYGVVANFFQISFLVLNIILLYFKESRLVALNYFVFFLTNAIFSYLSLGDSLRYHGLGYLLSTFITLILSYWGVVKTLRQLNYTTFMRQPVKNVSVNINL